MGEKGKKLSVLAGSVTPESVKIVAESVGLSDLSDAVLTYIADEMTFRLRHTVQDAKKLMWHGKRRKLSTADIDQALRLHNVEPLYGFHASEFVPFRHATGGGRDIHFTEEKDIDLSEIISSQVPKVPLEISIRAHWLSIDGDQPAVPENPGTVSRDLQRLDSHDPSVKTAINRPQKVGDLPHRTKAKIPEKVRLKELTTHELSIEQQLYYKEVTEACVGSDETRRSEALHSLTSDPGLYQMLPHFSTFISEGVKVNVTQNNLALLIYLMRMVKSLMDNPTLYLEKYLHELIPALMSCIISRQLCLRPDIDNHWALRDFAARLLAQLCKTFTTSSNMIQTRITKMLSAALQADTAPLATHYGAIVGIGELGHEVVKVFILPMLRAEADRLQSVLEGPLGNNTDRIAADHVKVALLKLMPPVLKTSHPLTDTVDDYAGRYGYLGCSLHAAVVKLRQTTTSTTTSQSPAITGSTSRTATALPFLQAARAGGALSSVHRPMTPTVSQKYVLLTPPAQPAAAAAGRPGSALTSSSASSQLMRMMTPAPSAASSAAKLVVVTVHSGSPADTAARSLVAGTSTCTAP